MHRFFLSPEECAGRTLVLRGPEAYHAIRVLRMHQGEQATLMDGQGHELLSEVVEVARDHVVFRVLQKQEFPVLPYRFTLVQALTKAKSMDWIVQKAVELGVSCLAPVQASRSVVQVESDDAGRKVEKWKTTIVEAVKQCGSPWLPKVDPPMTVQARLQQDLGCELVLLASLQPGSRHPREYFNTFVAANKRPPSSVAVWVGPEGDFTPAELSLIQSAGGLPITLGPTVLRSETAALYCLSVLSYELQALHRSTT